MYLTGKNVSKYLSEGSSKVYNFIFPAGQTYANTRISLDYNEFLDTYEEFQIRIIDYSLPYGVEIDPNSKLYAAKIFKPHSGK